MGIPLVAARGERTLGRKSARRAASLGCLRGGRPMHHPTSSRTALPREQRPTLAGPAAAVVPIAHRKTHRADLALSGARRGPKARHAPCALAAVHRCASCAFALTAGVAEDSETSLKPQVFCLGWREKAHASVASPQHG